MRDDFSPTVMATWAAKGLGKKIGQKFTKQRKNAIGVR